MGENLNLVLRGMVGHLEAPALACLLVVTAWAMWEAGHAVGERLRGLRTLSQNGDLEETRSMGRRRIERADMLARIGPMLGLVGTLIPLGPGLAAPGRGEVSELARAVTVASDTPVLGLLVGMAGFVLGRLRRRWYDQLLDQLEANHA